MPRPNGSAFRSTSSASPRNGGSDAYASAMRAAVEHFRAQGVTHFIFGDIHLHDVRRYREAQLTPYGLEVVEPLWDETSEQIIEGLPRLGAAHRGGLTMADRLGAEAIGRELDAAFVASLPAGTDPNGENGEYHTFCYDGPIFRSPVPFRLGPPQRRSHDIRHDDDGTVHTYTYWFAELEAAE